MTGSDVRAAIENVYWLGEVLATDAKFAITLRATAGDTPEARRAYVRSAFAFAEGMTHAFKRFALAVHADKASLFSEAEVAMLRGVTYELEDSGDAVTRSKYLRFAPNIRLALRAFSRAQGCPDPIDFSTAGWQALREGARIRNRLMHPRTPTDLEVSDADLELVDQGIRWFQSETGRLMGYRGAEATPAPRP